MAIIQGSRDFEGSEMAATAGSRVFKSNIRSVSFRDDKNKQGNHFVLLSAYKVDRGGKGVWYKSVKVREQFGLDVKESFPSRDSDPIMFFANQAKLHFPNFAKPEDAVVEGRTMKKFPPFGKISNKVVYNCAYLKDLSAGAHVLLVPEYFVGQTIEAWGRTRNSDGELNPMLNDHNRAIPVWLQMKIGGVGMPWICQIDGSKHYKLPSELADTEYIYNLDDVLNYPEEDYLITKLRSITPADIFDKCMEGWFAQHRSSTVPGVDVPQQPGAYQAEPAPFTIPKATTVAAPSQTVIAPSMDIPKAKTTTTSNPIVSDADAMKKAREFLRSQQP